MLRAMDQHIVVMLYAGSKPPSSPRHLRLGSEASHRIRLTIPQGGRVIDGERRL